MSCVTPEQIDALLPQTQCGLCGHGGCMPYAEAIVFEKATINLCPPGGVTTLKALGELTQQDSTPYLNEMEQKAKPALLAQIRENECIGCAKCIKVCPVDAILGSGKQMHTVIAAECTGCELCVPACPVDCIDLVTIGESAVSTFSEEKKNTARKRFNHRQERFAEEKQEKRLTQEPINLMQRKSYIQEAIARAKLKKK